MTLKSKPDGGKLKRFKTVGRRASYVVTEIDTTSSFRTKMKIEVVFRGQAVINPLCYDIQRETFSEVTSGFDD